MPARMSTLSHAVSEVGAHRDLRHVLVVGGSLTEWGDGSAAQWRERINTLGAVAQAAGASWLTFRPYGQGGATTPAPARREHVLDGGCTVIVEPTADGRARFAAAMAGLDPSRPVTEASVAEALYRPAQAEPDLVLVLGSDRQLPPSLVWELGYAELVFTDVPWPVLDAEVLAAAIDEFAGRSRRFGGLP